MDIIKLTRLEKIKQTKLLKFSNNPLKDNNDWNNLKNYLSLSIQEIDNLKNSTKQFIKSILTKSNGNLNMERLVLLDKTYPEILKNICSLTYFSNNEPSITLPIRIKLLLQDKNKLDYCSCGKVNNVFSLKETIFAPSCGNPDCFYKIVTEALNGVNRKQNDIKKAKTIENDKMEFLKEYNKFIDDISNYSSMDYVELRKQINSIYKKHNKENNKKDICIFGSSKDHIIFNKNKELIKSILFHTQFIEFDKTNLDITKRLFYILKNKTSIVLCKNCKKIEPQFLNIKLGYRENCKDCIPFVQNISKGENEIYEYLLSKGLELKKTDKTVISPLELDIVIPSKKIAIEFNGLYWHSSANGKFNKYHLTKTEECEKKGYRLIHIFEDEWMFKKNIVKARLRNILGLTKYKIYARKCTVKTIDENSKNLFLDKYHIQGTDNSSIKLGLFYRNKLVSVMTFGKRRFDSKDGYELIRYATLANFNIIGGAGKLLAHFRTSYNNPVIISYADRRWSTGNLYKKLGFSQTRISPPNYFYINGKKQIIERLSRINFQKHKLKDKLEIFDPSLTEWENTELNGFYRIHDCGNYVFELKPS